MPMASSVKLWSFVLLMQCLLVAWVLTSDQQTDVSSDVYFSVDASLVDSVIITSENGKALKLMKQGGKWLLPDYFNLPVDTGLQQQLLMALSETKADRNIAQTEAASLRFNVAADNFKRHVVVSAAGKPVLDAYFGGSPGFKSIYARKKSSNNIHVIKLGLHLMPDTVEQWFDKGLLSIQGTVLDVKGADAELYKQGEQWMMRGMEQQQLNQDEAQRLLRYLEHMQVTAVVEPLKAQGLADSKVDYSFVLKSALQSVKYDFYKLDDGVVVKSDQRAEYFYVSDVIGKSVGMIAREHLLEDTSQVP